MSKLCQEAHSIGQHVSVVERLVVIAGVLPTCHLIWRTVLSSKLGDEKNLPLVHVWIADWIIRPRVLLMLAVAFGGGLVCVLLAKKVSCVWVSALRILSVVVLVITLCLSALAITALLFPIQSMPPQIGG